jgi:hypothetical protein
MERQKAEISDELPKVLTTLVSAIIRLEGQKSEGIFRVPGDAEAVAGKKMDELILVRFKVSNR